jgi:hypothetical protein
LPKNLPPKKQHAKPQARHNHLITGAFLPSQARFDDVMLEIGFKNTPARK